MEMDWEIRGSTFRNLRSDLGICNSQEKGACYLFDEMSASDWRSPSRVLEVTVRQACYPITEEEHVSDTSLALASVTNVDAVVGVTNIKLPTTCSTLGFDVDSNANHAASTFPLVEAASKVLNSKKLHVEVVSSEAQADATAVVEARHGIILAVQHVADELQEHMAPMAVKDVIPVLNVTATASSASDILPSNCNISMSAPGNAPIATQVSPRTTSALDITMLSSKLMLQNMLGFTILASSGD
ncbi:hypothetical protein C2845_PM09G13420 [Panicum miliaceum]|uniref:Uncharacterized protein n=1 Tax=Panicum miliaceum TaxID=4540 RepID=A0A3L6S4W2_PANMI|nr:hypothetical protein C2845_PM09G13420 [Panicum miliaceum]